MLESFLSIAGSVASLYGIVSNIKSGKNFESIEKLIIDNTIEIQKLSDNIIYLPNKLGVIDTSKSAQSFISNLRDIREALEPIQKITKNKIISSAAIETPIVMGEAMKLNPWQVLVEPRPLNLATPHPNPDMVPILFEHDGVKFIGWQLKGTLPLLFGCDLNVKEDHFSNFNKPVRPSFLNIREKPSYPGKRKNIYKVKKKEWKKYFGVN